MGRNVPGYTTSLVVSLLMGGLTIFSLGIVGEYVGKIYLEAKARPRYIVESFIWKKGNCENFGREKQKNSNPAAISDNSKRKASLYLNSLAKVFIKFIKTPINIKDKISLEKMTIVNYTLKYG